MAAQFEQTRQALCAAISWQQIQTYFGLTKSREWFGDADMTGERELHATAQRNAVDRGDRRLVHRLDLAKCQMGIVR